MVRIIRKSKKKSVKLLFEIPTGSFLNSHAKLKLTRSKTGIHRSPGPVNDRSESDRDLS